MRQNAAPLLYWCETTRAQPFETGIQRVTRRLGEGLERRGIALAPVGWEPRTRLIRFLELGWSGEAGPGAAGMLIPEIPMTVLGEDLDPVQLARAYGLRATAIVHDLIPLRLASLYSPAEQTIYRRYYRMFARANLVLATTHLVASHLRAHLASEGLPVPKIAVVPLPAQFGTVPRVRQAPPAWAPSEPLRLLSVATWEPRKNLAQLLRGVRLAQERSGAVIHLTLVGRRAGYAAHDTEIMELLAELPHARALDWTGDDAMAEIYGAHHASVYASCEEGFGLPVLESLWLGRPCLCHSGSAMAEVAPGGGTLLLDMADEASIADALLRLWSEPALLERLTDEALGRSLRTWADYTAEVAVRL